MSSTFRAKASLPESLSASCRMFMQDGTVLGLNPQQANAMAHCSSMCSKKLRNRLLVTKDNTRGQCNIYWHIYLYFYIQKICCFNKDNNTKIYSVSFSFLSKDPLPPKEKDWNSFRFCERIPHNTSCRFLSQRPSCSLTSCERLWPPRRED